MTSVNNDKEGLTFEIISTKISDEEKRYVLYTLQVRFITTTGNEDSSPSTIERRYTHFLNLYNALKKDYSQLMTNVTFPKKVILGNFDNQLISARSTGFESLLNHICNEGILRNSQALLNFLQEDELNKAKILLEKNEFVAAYPILENNFKLLNKVFTDRSPPVLLALCRLLATTMSIPGTVDSLKWADLALHRYDGVSDSDLLELYVPLLCMCSKVWRKHGRNPEELEGRVKYLQRQGMRMNKGGDESLLDVVSRVEKKIFNVN